MIDDVHKTTWGNRFIAAAIIQGGIMTLLAISMVGSQFIFASKANIIQFLSLSFEGPAKWFFSWNRFLSYFYHCYSGHCNILHSFRG